MNLARKLIIIATIALAGAFQLYAMMPKSVPAGSFDYDAFGRLLVQDGGRVKPLDTFARVALTVINHKQSCTDAKGRPLPPAKWLLEVMSLTAANMDAEIANARMFRIDDPQVVEQLGLELRPGNWRYTLAELKPKAAILEAEFKRVGRIDERKHTAQDRRIAVLGKHLQDFLSINQWQVATIPPDAAESDSWTTPSALRSEELERRAFAEVAKALRAQNIDARTLTEEDGIRLVTAEQRKLLNAAPPAARAFVDIIDAYQRGNPQQFNTLVAQFPKFYNGNLAEDIRRANLETWFNRMAPFYYGIWLYLLSFVLAMCGWIASWWTSRLAGRLFTAASALACWTFVVHTVALLWRMYLMDRPLVFVTNLYSSAIFIGWCAAAIGIAVEWLRGRGIGMAMAGIAGASSLIVAYYIDLGMEGDKLEMMQAVLDTNFWLATHVTTVTFGYAATFIAGLLGTAFILIGVMTPFLDRDLTKILSGLIYGVVCFATLLSFTGTVLGGIWADYSWGRFWGWDPKENGAMLIVLWNALILHARWGGMVKSRGIAVLAVFGNIVTAWSWFGTNQLGVGLHSYGFTSAAALALVAFNATMLAIMALGMLPERVWLSRQPGLVKLDSAH